MASPKIVAVSGSKGLIGSRLLAANLENLQFLPISISRLSIAETRNAVLVAKECGASTFLHLSWPAATFAGDYRTSIENFTALEKTLIVKEECLKNDLHFVGLGSQVDQDSDGKTLYSLTKTIARGVFDRAILGHEISWLRPFYVFEEDRWPSFLMQSTVGPVEIQDDSPRDFVHIKDIVSGIQQIISQGLRGQIDLGSGLHRRPSELCFALGVPFTTRPEAHIFARRTFPTASLDPRLAQVWQPTHTNRVFRGNFE